MRQSNSYLSHEKLRGTTEWARLTATDTDWYAWGPYLSERAWGTVREDYEDPSNPWEAFPHDHARSRAYRWNEDGIAGVSDRFQRWCLAVALWNGVDPILKERHFGLTGPQGNHGEDVKEYYFFLDNLPTHSWMRMLYKYPQVAYPYEELVAENARRDKNALEYELVDALGQAFEESRYWDVVVDYAKAGPGDLLCRTTLTNRGPEPATIHLLPHLWARNTWSWGTGAPRPALTLEAPGTVLAQHPDLPDLRWYVDDVNAPILFTDNETNTERLFGHPNSTAYVKDGIGEAVVHGRAEAVHPSAGTKVAAHVVTVVAPGDSLVVRTRLVEGAHHLPFADFEEVMTRREQEADEFYAALADGISADDALVQRQALAGMLWTKQFYHYDVAQWLDGDPAGAPPPEARRTGRNSHWRHLRNHDIVSMPDTWEYPWYAVWDSAFHMLPFALIDPGWAKEQLLLFLRERYLHPNGQIPAYEWDFDDVNPPVHAWAVWRVYKIDRNVTGVADTDFLERAFHKLLLNFTWWVNRKDPRGRNVFEGGFLGLDNIGVFDRSRDVPMGGHLEQSDSTSWMAMYSLNMLAISLELARTRPAYEDVALKFLEHFVYIANAIHDLGLWDEDDGFFYDVLQHTDAHRSPLRVRSLVGLVPLFAVETIDSDLLRALPNVARRIEWFARVRPELVRRFAAFATPGRDGRRLLSLMDRGQLERVLAVMLDESEFLSPWGIRSMSRAHLEAPFAIELDGQTHQVAYEPGESRNYMFGGNSNWRGPVWFPMNYLIVESLQKYAHYYGDDLRVAVPTGGAPGIPLDAMADELSRRLVSLFVRDEGSGRRTVFGGHELFQSDPHWRDAVPFYEYFDGDTGAGLGASHQTGWTALVAKLIHRLARDGS